MQVEDETIANLVTVVRNAFPGVPIPPDEALLLPEFASSEDVYEMMTVFRGKHWAEIPIVDLFRQRESLFALSPIGYQTYLPAYLVASLTTHEKYGADLRSYMVHTLKAFDYQDELRAETTRRRLEILDPAQRTAVADILCYLAKRWHMNDAAEVLRDWR